MPPPYAELHCLSNFTFLRGASHPEELVARAHALGYEALALTDECSLAGVVRAFVAAKTCGLALLIGTEVRITDGPKLVLLATDRDAYGDLSALITAGRRRAGKGRYHLRRADLETGLSACLALLLPEDTPRDEEEARWLARRFPGRAWIAVELMRGGADRARLRRLEGLGQDTGLPLCAAGDIHMHGRERAALTATVITYRPKSAIRDVGKALGLGLDEVDRLAKNVYWWDGKGIVPSVIRRGGLSEIGLDPENPVIARLMRLVREIVGFPRHLSQHVGGFVISRGPLSRLVPIENAAMEGRTVIEWDKTDLDALGLLKIDCLGLGMLSAIHRAFDLIQDYRGERLTLASVPAEDPETYAMIEKADTVGVFQIESRAQMAMLPRLKPRCYYDLVIEIAIIRPGPIQGEMVHPYLRRRAGLEPVTYPSEAVRAVLGRTLGVPLFQEQVIKLAMVAAGFSAGEADRLRRSMATWRQSGGIEDFEGRLIEGMRQRGYPETYARRIFEQIRGFGEYGFPESHAASFALLAYCSAWLKCHEPAAFTCALLNSQPMGFYAPAQLVQDARRHGVEVRPIDVGVGDWDCTLEGAPPALRLGLRMVKGLSRAGAERITAAARPFRDVQDLARRARLNRRDLEALAAADALRGLCGNRHQARWQVLGIEAPLPLGEMPALPEPLPLLRRPTEGEDIVADYGSLGLTLRRHPLALLRPVLTRLSFQSAREVLGLTHGRRAHAAGLVITRQRPGTATGVVFLTLEDETGPLNVIVWSSLFERERRIVLGARLMGVTGEVQREGEVVHLIAHKLEDRTALLGGLRTVSRDFC